MMMPNGARRRTEHQQDGYQDRKTGDSDSIYSIHKRSDKPICLRPWPKPILM